MEINLFIFTTVKKSTILIIGLEVDFKGAKFNLKKKNRTLC